MLAIIYEWYASGTRYREAPASSEISRAQLNGTIMSSAAGTTIVGIPSAFMGWSIGV